MDFCPRCGAFVNRNTNTCPECGYTLRFTDSPPKSSRQRVRFGNASIAIVISVVVIGMWGVYSGIITQITQMPQGENNPTSEQPQYQLSNSIPQKSQSNLAQQITNPIVSGEKVLGNIIRQTTQTFNPRSPPSQEELYQYALAVINTDRKSHGVGPVALGDIPSAQNHADDMLKAGYFSHWNTDGVKPYVTYTKLGGRGDVAENISYVQVYCPVTNCIANSFDPFKEINDSEYSMMYNDVRSNWGHRDNIINPDHTYVNLGIVYDNQRFYFVENFENDIVNWQTVSLSGDQLHLAGQMPSGYSLYYIDVFSDPSPQSLSSEELDGSPPYNAGYYDQGQLVGIMLPQLSGTYFYPECGQEKTSVQSTEGARCVDYTTFANTSSLPNGIDIRTDVSKWQGNGLHTIYVYLKKPNGDQVSASSVTLEYLR